MTMTMIMVIIIMLLQGLSHLLVGQTSLDAGVEPLAQLLHGHVVRVNFLFLHNCVYLGYLCFLVMGMRRK